MMTLEVWLKLAVAVPYRWPGLKVFLTHLGSICPRFGIEVCGLSVGLDFVAKGFTSCGVTILTSFFPRLTESLNFANVPGLINSPKEDVHSLELHLTALHFSCNLPKRSFTQHKRMYTQYGQELVQKSLKIVFATRED